MGSGYNKVILLGNLVRDVELRYTPSNKAVADVPIAVNGFRDDDTCFVDLTIWQRQAEVAAEYLKKGSPVLIEGRLEQDRWEDSQGDKKSKHKVTVERLTLVPTSGGGAEPVPAGASSNEIPF